MVRVLDFCMLFKFEKSYEIAAQLAQMKFLYDLVDRIQLLKSTKENIKTNSESKYYINDNKIGLYQEL